ncbi:MAG: pyrroline-5-carboxylate reductase [Oscillospiraceae bacterium]|nr:pyrroline-5-carboxylate reductase [Oscillospiraceae bacterium]
MLGFIGTGNMATAIIKGVLSAGTLKPEEIAVCDLNCEKAQALGKETGVKVVSCAADIAEKCDKVLLSVKPNVFPELLKELDPVLKKNQPLIISIAAGKTLAFIGSFLSFSGRIVRVMPNINAKVGAAVSAYCPGEGVSEEERRFVKTLCESFGTAIELEEKFFPIFGVIGGCSPAFAYMFIDSLARGAVKNGMPKAQALEVAAQAVLGSAKMILESGEHPWTLVDQVCSPGGTTIEGVAALQEKAFESAVTSAVDAAFQKDSKI